MPSLQLLSVSEGRSYEEIFGLSNFRIYLKFRDMRNPKTLSVLSAIAILPSFSQAATTVNGAVYSVNEGVDFAITNAGNQSFQLTWSDPGAATFSNVVDPTLVLTVGQTYTFERFTVSHPFAITSSEMDVTGSDGAFARVGNQNSDIQPFILSPAADFTAGQSSANGTASGDPIVWTPTAADLGDYWYTCTIRGHRGMTGKITVVPEPSASALSLLALGFLARRKR